LSLENLDRLVRRIFLPGVVVACSLCSFAQESPTLWDSLQDSLVGGKVELNLRLRAEFVEQDGLDTARALTERLRLGYGTKPFHGFSVYADLEDIRTTDDDRFNAAGLNRNPGKAVVADPEDTELNQAFLSYDGEYFDARVGRQRIILDDHRFVGNVGWRQNEQTFDAATVSSDWIPETRLFYSYVEEVRRIFGPDADRDFDSQSHLLNGSYSGLPLVGTLTAFAYLLDFINSPANSSDTLGLRLAGSHGLVSELSAGWLLSYAHQSDAAGNPVSYDADYYLVEGTLSLKDRGSLGFGYEVLGSDDRVFAFQTPLATLHAFNGWADVFLVTPNAGLQDLYLTGGASLPLGIQATGVFHWFFNDDGGRELGNELDLLASKALSKHFAVLVKAALFDGDSGLADVQKYWIQAELKF
jgi:hypothetical protein